MTLCLTFDDGLKAHADVAAPLLEKYGWRGAFNVPTRMLDGNAVLDADALWDYKISKSNGSFMSWRDAATLVSHGHEVYPHTLDHTDLLALERSGRVEEMRRQIACAKNDIEKHLGYSPKFFCSPHNSQSTLICDLIHQNGMELLNCWRRNFPRHPNRTPQVMSISEYLHDERMRMTDHVDVMIHGVGRERGGWEPFETAADFETFLLELKDLERRGLIRIVPYSSAHIAWGRMRKIHLLARRVRNKIKRTMRCIFEA